mgnify:CR=1 FL=1
MDHEIRHRPSFALVDVNLERGESITAEAGAMVAHTDGIEIDTGTGKEGFLKKLKRSTFGGEKLFRNTFSAPDTDGTVTFAPPLPGDVVQHQLRDQTVFVSSGGYLAGDDALDVDTKWGGGKSFLGGEGFFLLKISGSGPLFTTSYGAVEPVDLSSGQRHTVDTGHVVAFEQSVSWSVRRVGGLKSTLFSGEGLVCDFEGPGTVWLQSRSQDAFVSWLVPKLPVREGSGGNVQFDLGSAGNLGGFGGRGGKGGR